MSGCVALPRVSVAIGILVAAALRYAWEGTVEPERGYSFAHLLMPGLPQRKPVRSNVPGAASLADITGQYMAAGHGP